MKSAFNPFEMAQAQFDKSADILGLDPATRDLLRFPLREYHFAIPVKMDDGKVKVFRGFRVQHNDARALEGRHPLPPAGDRRHGPRPRDVDDPGSAPSSTSLSAGRRAASSATRTTSRHASRREIRRGWVRQVAKNVGPVQDVPAPDVMTTPQHMLWMLDEWERSTAGRDPASSRASRSAWAARSGGPRRRATAWSSPSARP